MDAGSCRLNDVTVCMKGGSLGDTKVSFSLPWERLLLSTRKATIGHLMNDWDAKYLPDISIST